MGVDWVMKLWKDFKIDLAITIIAMPFAIWLIRYFLDTLAGAL